MTIAIGKRRVPITVSVYFVGMAAFCFAAGSVGKISLGLLFAGLHELGHLGAMAAFRARPQRVCLTVAGMRIDRPPGLSLSFAQEIIIAFAGPAVSLILAGLFGALTIVNCQLSILYDCAAINLGFALFNLLPVRQLDGGRALYYSLCRRLNETAAEHICLGVSLLCLFVITASAAFMCLRYGLNLPLVVAVIYLALNC